MNERTQEIKELVEQLNVLREAYYNEARPLVSDKYYDTLLDKLEKLESETGIIFSDSPTQTVGYPIKKEFKKVTHSHPMLSLAKTKDLNEFAKYCKNQPSLISLKMDGLTVLLTYLNGELIQAETRGDGLIGELITENAKNFLNIPLTIPYMGRLEIEGEAIITQMDFERINSRLSDKDKYSNPRNLASGSVRQLDPSITARRCVRFIAWKVPYIERIDGVDTVEEFNDFAKRLDWVEDLGFTIVPYYFVNNGNAELCIRQLKGVADHMTYPFDGFVQTFRDIKYGESLGNTGHHPKHSFVLKEQDDEYETVLKDITWQVGKTGIITPIAIFDPVDIDNVIVEKASVHNISILTQLNLQPGDKITVYRANQVIPQIKDNITGAERWLKDSCYVHIPATCPVCGSPTKIKRDNESDVLICTNPYCKGKMLGKYRHFVSKDAMDIQGLSEQTLQKFMDYGWLDNYISLYYLAENQGSKISRLDGFGAKSADKLFKAIEASKHTTLDRFINALSIPNIGKETAKVIAKHFNYNFVKFGMALNTRYNWQKLPDFGLVMQRSLEEFWKDNSDWVTELGLMMDFYNPDETKVRNNSLKGMNFVITGKLLHFKNRDELVQKIEDCGGKVSGSVSKNTNYLINNDVNSDSGKNKKAKELGIKIISEEDFMRMIE